MSSLWLALAMATVPDVAGDCANGIRKGLEQRSHNSHEEVLPYPDGSRCVGGIHGGHHAEPAMARHWHGHLHHEVCRIVVKKRAVWRHGHKKVIRYKVKRCWWRW